MVKQQQRQALPLFTVFLMAFLVVSAMNAVPAEAGRTLGQIGYIPLDPSRTPSTGPSKPYTRPCVYENNCHAPPHVP